MKIQAIKSSIFVKIQTIRAAGAGDEHGEISLWVAAIFFGLIELIFEKISISLR